MPILNPLKMPGCKRRVMAQILPLLPGPEEVQRVHVPFFGTGYSAQAFADAGYALGRLGEGSEWIWRVHSEMRSRPASLTREADTLACAFESEDLEGQRRLYHSTRERLNARGPFLSDGSEILCLWRMAFNGLMRTNARGLLNMPPGVSASTGRKATVYDRAALEGLCAWWSSASPLAREDFSATLEAVQPGDLVYLDPPYEGTFTGYMPGGFSTERMVQAIRSLPPGVRWAMSNSRALEWSEIFPGSEVHAVTRAGTVNSDRTKRGQVGEVIVVGGSA